MKRVALMLGFLMTGCFASSGSGDVTPVQPKEAQPKAEEVKEVPIKKEEIKQAIYFRFFDMKLRNVQFIVFDNKCSAEFYSRNNSLSVKK